MALSSELNNKGLIAANLNSLGTIDIYLNNKSKAFDLFSRSLLMHRELGDADGICNALINLSTYNKEQKKYTLAKSQITEALKLSTEIQYMIKFYCYHILSTIEFELGNYKAAYEYQSMFKQLTDSIFNVEKLETIK